MKNRPWIKFYDKNVPKSLEYPHKPLHAFLVKSARNFPDKVCTVCNGREITYHQMDLLTTKAAFFFRQSGLRKGDRVGLFLPNIPEFVIAFYGVSKAGGVIAAINPAFKPQELIHQANDAGIIFLVTLQSKYDAIKSIQSKTTIARIIVVKDLEPEINTYSELSGVQPPDIFFDEITDQDFPQDGDDFGVNPDDPAVFQYTGGTTGTPKAAIGLHRNLVANSLQFRNWLADIEVGKEVFLMAIPMYHVYGMVIGMSLCIATAGLLVLVPDPRDIVALVAEIHRYQVTIFPGVPSLFGMISHNLEVNPDRSDLRSIRIAISGSASLPVEIKNRFEHLISGKLCEGYGLSEAPTATHCNPIHGENRLGSIGLPLPDVDSQIVDMENGTIRLTTGEVGELIVRGPQVMVGYHNQSKETANAIRSGWLFTGDIGKMDEDGYFYLVGRKKELIKVSGFQVWPREIEEVISAHPQIVDVCVAGVPDAKKGEVVKAWVIKKPGSSLTQDDIKTWCEPSLAYFKIPVLVEFRTEFPRTPVGKILKRELIRQHLEGMDPTILSH